MRHIEDWDAIQEQNGGEFERATPADISPALPVWRTWRVRNT